MKKAITFLSLALALNLVSADQPVHCLRNEAFGNWTFSVATRTFDVDLFNFDTVCTHKAPNRVQILRDGELFDFGDEEYTNYTVELWIPNVAYVYYNGTTQQGNWSMMYDQGFFVQTDTVRFYTNFKYTLKTEYYDTASISSLSVASYDYFNSICYSSMVGTVVMLDTPGTFTCFYADKDEDQRTETTEEVAEDIEIEITYFESQSVGVNALAQVKYDDMQNFVDFVNGGNFSWKAQMNSRFTGLSLSELRKPGQVVSPTRDILSQTNSVIGEDEDVSTVSTFNTSDPDFIEAWAEAKKYWDVSVEAFPEDELPESWDWRDVEGYDFTSEVRDQGGCGSCYTISFVTSLESRTKISTAESYQFSPQFLLDCNFYNEGCEGGWPILNGFWTENFYLPTETCAPYKGTNLGETCSLYSNCAKAVTVSNSQYIGYFYGGNSEAQMMKELRSRGPIISDLNVPLGFSYYQSGIFSDEHVKALAELSNEEFIEDQTSAESISEFTLSDYHIEWEYINHSISVIGWGVEDGVKYWICRNSYGTNWGEDGGHFRVRRGANDFGIESEATAYMPELLL